MQQGGAHGQAVAFFHQVSHDFGREAGERRESAQKAGDQQQAPDRVELRHGLEHRDGDADQVAAEQVGGQRAPRNHTAGRQPQGQAPAGQRAQGSADGDGKNRQHRASVFAAA
ncbi:MAG: hypothetical protein JWP96_576 [Polaromonas sp.]|nr:hypothetical protein [Polaromonas sp.]